MAIKKAKFKPPVYDANGIASYPDTVYMETTADLVKIDDSNVELKLQEVASELSNLATQKADDTRVDTVESLVNSVIGGEIQAVLNNELVATDIASKLLAKETEYAPRLTTAEAQINSLGANVIMFGAKGDGITDDTLAIQSAIDFVNTNGGGIVYFPKPIVKYIAVNLNVYSNTILQGAGWNTIIEQKFTEVVYDHLFNVVGETENITDNKLNIVVRDIQLKGTVEANGFSQFQHLLVLQGVSNVLIENVKFVGWRGDALAIVAGYQLKHHNQRVTVRNCYFDGVNKTNRQCITITDCDKLLIENNYFTKSTKPDMPGAIDIEPNADYPYIILNDITIRNNKFYDIGGSIAAIAVSIVYTQTQLPQPVKNITIENNEIDTVITGMYFHQLQTADVADGTEGINIKILNNKIKNVSERPLKLLGIKDALVFGNEIDTASSAIWLGYTLSYDNCVNVKFEKNIFRKIGTTDGIGVLVYGNSKRIDFINNTFDDIGLASNSYGIGIHFSTGTSSFVRIINNTFIKPLGRITVAVSKAASGILTPTGNEFKGNILNGLTHGFVADLTDFGITSSVFTEATLPNTFLVGITSFKVTGAPGLPTGYTDGTIVTYKISDIVADREFVTQWYYPKNAGGTSLTDNFYRRANDATNDWGVWYKVSGVLA